MGSVTLFNAARMQAIEDGTVTSGLVDTDGNLILSHHDGSQINAGNVVGPRGPQQYLQLDSINTAGVTVTGTGVDSDPWKIGSTYDLPDRLKNGQEVTDWNDAIVPGFYYATNPANAPTPIDGGSSVSNWVGFVLRRDDSSGGPSQIFQEIHEERPSSNSFLTTFRRYASITDGTPSWSIWYASYGTPVSGFLSGTNGWSPDASCTLTKVNGMATMVAQFNHASHTPANPSDVGSVPAGFLPHNTFRGPAILFGSGQYSGFQLTSSGALSIYNQGAASSIISVRITVTYPVQGG